MEEVYPQGKLAIYMLQMNAIQSACMYSDYTLTNDAPDPSAARRTVDSIYSSRHFAI